MSLVVKSFWTLDEAISLIRGLQPECRKFSYHLCLGGGVLNKGQSKHDLDLYFLPMGKKEDIKAEGLVRWLESLWGKGEAFKAVPKLDVYGERLIVGHNEFGEPRYDYPEEEQKYAFAGKFNYGELRIDVFVVGGEKIEAATVTSEDRNDMGRIPEGVMLADGLDRLDALFGQPFFYNPPFPAQPAEERYIINWDNLVEIV